MIGTGYVGLVSGTCFAELGFETVCVDKNPQKIETLNNGGVPIFEPGLDELIKRQVEGKRLSFTTDVASAVQQADIVFIGVGTPTSADGMSTDLSYVESAAKDIAENLKGYTAVVVKSTVPVGTCRHVESIIRKANPKAEFNICSNPEFLREGSAIQDFLAPDRVVVGTDNPKSKALLQKLYSPLEKKGHSVLFTKIESSELIKYAANAFLATKISFINQIADLAEKVGADVSDIALGIGLDNRIGKKFLQAGPGYGGSCFPKDTKSLATTAKQFDCPITIVDAVIQANEDRKKAMAQRVSDAFNSKTSGKTIAVLGVAFKPNTDDMRDAPALDILPALIEMGFSLKAYDPEATEEAKKILKQSEITWCNTKEDALQNSDALLVLTEWDEFMALTPGVLEQYLNTKTVIDLRNIFNVEDMTQAGFTYISIGKKPHFPLKEINIKSCNN